MGLFAYSVMYIDINGYKPYSVIGGSDRTSTKKYLTFAIAPIMTNNFTISVGARFDQNGGRYTNYLSL